MIYFDNAATTMQKPPEVARAVAQAINQFGGVGRGAHDAALSADMAVYIARKRIAQLLGAPSAKHVAFMLNVTEALNAVISGLLRAGDHAVTTAASHNSVLRPLYRKQDEEGVGLSILPVAPDGSISYEEFDALFTPQTKLAVVTHASNLTGDVYDIARMARIAHEHGALICVDAAQTAGVYPLCMAECGVDILAFTGHKGLMGPQGTGGLCLAEGIDLPHYNVGGSGTHSYDRQHPLFLPERLEAGTLNAHGIAGLSEGVAFIQNVGVSAVCAHEKALAQRFAQSARAISGVRLYGGGAADSVGIVALNVADVDSSVVSDVLSRDFGICTRPGAHCAPLMHEALGTSEQGAVRFSFGYFNTEAEVDEGIQALSQIAASIA
ncbi:cysteine desulfurase [Denitrobacterium detoxificans]|nr:aminotransferase class V-fold PLP-dependent enzyme [Denitrobacterium detoxificans]ANE22195.1 cysteine desulfurase [Denitrobacterium detoxificans]